MSPTKFIGLHFAAAEGKMAWAGGSARGQAGQSFSLSRNNFIIKPHPDSQSQSKIDR